MMKAVKKRSVGLILAAAMALITGMVYFSVPESFALPAPKTNTLSVTERDVPNGPSQAIPAPTPSPTQNPTPSPTPEPTPEPAVEMSVFGVSTMSDATELDLTGVKIADLEELTTQLGEIKRLKRVIMIHCGLKDEAMQELQSRFPKIEFVWITHIASCGVRTDTTYFTTYNPYEHLYNCGSLEGFRNCPDIVALDLGHGLSGLSPDGSYLRYLPHLKYLILYMAPYESLPELSGLKELEYLELMRSGIRDISPLRDCPNLKHLNLCNTYYLEDKEAALDVLCSLTQLERLWISDDLFAEEQLARLLAALPETKVHLAHGFGDICVNDGGWRLDPSYFEMRDALHMFYMTDAGGVQPVNPYTGERSKYENTNPF